MLISTLPYKAAYDIVDCRVPYMPDDDIMLTHPDDLQCRSHC